MSLYVHWNGSIRIAGPVAMAAEIVRNLCIPISRFLGTLQSGDRAAVTESVDGSDAHRKVTSSGSAALGLSPWMGPAATIAATEGNWRGRFMLDDFCAAVTQLGSRAENG